MSAKKASNHPKIVFPGGQKAVKTSGALAEHEYVMEVDHLDHKEKRKESSSLQNTPTKASAKKQKGEENPEISNSALLETLVARFDQQDGKLSSIERKITENSLMIVNLTKAVEFNAAEIKDCKTRINLFDKQLTSVITSHADLINRTSELERYKRRWNLRIIGMKEIAGEDIRKEIVSLLTEIAPHLQDKLEDIVDTVHRVGPKMKDKSRQVIIQFCMRKYRDEFWRSTKVSDVCKFRGIKFTEDLSKGDRDARAALWPKISEARAAGKKAYYRGPYGYIEETHSNPDDVKFWTSQWGDKIIFSHASTHSAGVAILFNNLPGKVIKVHLPPFIKLEKRFQKDVSALCSRQGNLITRRKNPMVASGKFSRWGCSWLLLDNFSLHPQYDFMLNIERSRFPLPATAKHS